MGTFVPSGIDTNKKFMFKFIQSRYVKKYDSFDVLACENETCITVIQKEHVTL